MQCLANTIPLPFISCTYMCPISVDPAPSLPKPEPIPGASTDPSLNVPVRFPSIKPIVLMLASPNYTPTMSMPIDPVPATFANTVQPGPYQLPHQPHMVSATSQPFTRAPKIPEVVSTATVIVPTWHLLITDTQVQIHLNIHIHTHHIHVT